MTSEQETEANFADQGGLRMLDGMTRSGGTPVTTLLGPTGSYYDPVPATGFKAAALGGLTTQVYSVGRTLNAFRGPGGNPLLLTNHNIAGVSITEFDADAGAGTNYINFNNGYWNQQAAAQMAAAGRALGRYYVSMCQGTADKARDPGFWYAAAETWYSELLAQIASAFPTAAPKLILGQSGGDADTSSILEGWYVCEEQIDFAVAHDALLVPEYPFTIDDNNVHPGVTSSFNLGETKGWAAHRHEQGLPWNLFRPAVARDGSLITLTYPAWANMVLAPDKYNGEGISHLGFEVTGAAIADVSVSGNQGGIDTTGGTPTALQYAMQAQNCKTFAGNAYTAHRGLLRTDLTATGPITGSTLYQWAPSFREAL